MRRVLYVIYACVVIGTYTVVIYSNDGTPRVGGTGYRSGGGKIYFGTIRSKRCDHCSQNRAE
jgi:hypothetical protein